MFCFGLTSDWLRKWGEFPFEPITNAARKNQIKSKFSQLANVRNTREKIEIDFLVDTKTEVIMLRALLGQGSY